MKKIGYMVGFALLFWIVASIGVGLLLALAGISYSEGTAGFWINGGALLLSLVAGAWYGLRRARGKEMDEAESRNSFVSEGHPSPSNRSRAPRAEEGSGVKYCMNCGQTLPAHARYCSSCGEPAEAR